ncbi:hypothetical protein NDU88_001436 [Pleurodeles waltl]|uniref:Uncharacterized protein n=1 Tax=Pleurodeles waltl TaxID=8319 RepID=A0AAV7TK39_PLEWA|nr:hypothetical protein NDU88_001436 [Pleurodeles waltl]
MDTMAEDINHLRLDLRRVAERVMTTEEEVTTLHTTEQERQATVTELRSNATLMNDWLKDAERCSHLNKKRLFGFPE